MAKKKEAACKRPYSLGKRLELSDQKRATVLSELRKQLEAKGFTSLTLDGLAQASGVTRQTIYNLFASKTGLLEALFDQIALEGGMERMRNVMTAANPAAMLASFVQIFINFWSKDRILLRRVHGIAAIDPELEAVVGARNQRRRFAATRVIEMLDSQSRRDGADKDVNKEQRIAMLLALTSFEFFDALSESCGGVDRAAHLLPRIVRNALSSES